MLNLLELNDIEDKLVGSIGDGGLSVEEAKRLTIGVELVCHPEIHTFHDYTLCFQSYVIRNVVAGSESKHFVSG